jgi:hypothetical protein
MKEIKLDEKIDKLDKLERLNENYFPRTYQVMEYEKEKSITLSDGEKKVQIKIKGINEEIARFSIIKLTKYKIEDEILNISSYEYKKNQKRTKIITKEPKDKGKRQPFLQTITLKDMLGKKEVDVT